MPTINRSNGQEDTPSVDEINVDESAVFSEEMAFLTRLQTRFLNLHSQVPVEHNDPDVRYLTQAMAAFMAKGRMAGRQQIDQLHQRVFQQLLPYLTAPVASMALLQANTRNLTETVAIKAGSLFTLTTNDGEQAQYRSLCNMPLAPIAIENVGQVTKSRNEHHVHITITAHNRAPGPLEHLPLYLTAHNNFALSLSLRELLGKQLVNVTAIFDEQDPCIGRFSIGPCQTEAAPESAQQLPEPGLQGSPIDSMHPVENIRRFFQLPQQENFLNLYFSSSPQQWKSCQLILTLSGQWPRQIAMSSELFQLGVICVENRIQEQAEAINYKATQSSCPVRPPTTATDLRLLKCIGVYQGALKDRNMLRPGILKGGSGAYDMYFRSNATGELQPELDIQLPDAFKKPVKVTVDALWHQPGFSKHLWKKITVRTHYLDIPGLSWSLLNTPVPYVPLNENDAQSLLDLSLLKNKNELSLDDVLFILENMGSVFQREFQSLKRLLTHLQVIPTKDKPFNQHYNWHRPSAHYIFALDNSASICIPLVNTFFSKIEALLNAWLSNTAVTVCLQTEFSSADEPPLREIQQKLIGYSDTPIRDIVDECTDATDYRLIPPSAEHLFFADDDHTSTIFTSGNHS